MNGHDETIRRIATLVGIAEQYRDQEGQIVETPLESQGAVLAGLGLHVENESDAREALARVEALKNGLIPALLPTRSGRPIAVPLRGVTGGSATC